MTVRRWCAAVQGRVPCSTASEKMRQSPGASTGCVTKLTSSASARSASAGGTGKLDLCEPGTAQKPPSPGPAARSCMHTVSSWLRMRPLRNSYASGQAGSPDSVTAPPCSVWPSAPASCASNSGEWSSRYPTPSRSVSTGASVGWHNTSRKGSRCGASHPSKPPISMRPVTPSPLSPVDSRPYSAEVRSLPTRSCMRSACASIAALARSTISASNAPLITRKPLRSNRYACLRDRPAPCSGVSCWL
mmetsp:Transcript_31415/g.101573  ORF Transcript_31415/g.101573 Transcript_31415/m.101573 type:complete len:246 (-) Transcript_31415:151-888(-)